MTSTSFAPLLSATRRRDSCWIIGVPPTSQRSPTGDPAESPCPRFAYGSLCALQHFDHTPALQLGQGTGLLDPDAVALAGVVGLVVHVQLLRALDELGVPGVADALHDGHDDGLVHLRGHDDALAHLAGGAGHGRFVSHHLVSVASAAAISR